MQPPASLFNAGASRTLVIMSQVYVPDPASVGQHMHDVAVEMVRRGVRVIVFTADRGYEDPTVRHPRYELREGVHVIRLPGSSLGKVSIQARLAGASAFLAQATSLALGLRRLDHLLVSTSPPICGLAGIVLSRARRVPLTYWVMDLNPDQIVAVGGMSHTAWPVRALDEVNRRVLAQARNVVVLDDFMAERILRKHDVRASLHVIPPWSHVDSELSPIPHSENPFRARPELGPERVVMYSGNLSPVHPISTFLEAAAALGGTGLRFVFIGGGAGRAEIERARMAHVSTLPYQPLEQLRYSLSAADVHLVAMGEAMVGIVHPCKVYGAMAVGRPILALAPDASHIGRMLRAQPIGWRVSHADRAGMHAALRAVGAATESELQRKGDAARALVREHFAPRVLLHRFCELLA